MHASNAMLCRVCNIGRVIVTLSYNIDVVKPSWLWFVMAVEFVMYPGTGVEGPPHAAIESLLIQHPSMRIRSGILGRLNRRTYE